MSYPKPQPEHVLESQVWKLLEQGRAKDAVARCEQLNQRFPAYAPGWYTTSQLAQRLKNRGPFEQQQRGVFLRV